MVVGYFRGTGGVVHEINLPLAEAYADQERKGDLVRVNADGTPYEPPEDNAQGGSDLTNGTPPRPAQSAHKAEWVGYAVLVGGMSADDAEALTKQDLIDRFGKE